MLPRLKSEYERTYYAGVIAERRAKDQLQQGVPGFANGFRDAMAAYAMAIAIHPSGNEDAILRWNIYAGILMQNQPEGPEPPRECVPDIE